MSVVIPCLNEEGSIEECVRNAKAAFAHATGTEDLEVLVVDNGSTDRSAALASKAGARVILETRRGYGAALLRGMNEARNDYVVLADADNTYSFTDGARLVEELQRGAEFAIGDRLGGTVEPGAMPWLHRRIGTPILSFVLNRFFGTRITDINCGLRAIRRDAIARMRLRSPGMEFASEMVIHAAKARLKFAERPIHYATRKSGEAKLRTFRDGWRHLRFILLCAPFPLFFFPAILGISGGLALMQSDRAGFQVLASLLVLVAYQVLLFGVFAKAYLWVTDSFIVDQKSGKILDRFKLEWGILVGFGLLVLGLFRFSNMNVIYLIQGAGLVALGVQTVFSSFLLSIILSKRPLEQPDQKGVNFQMVLNKK